MKHLTLNMKNLPRILHVITIIALSSIVAPAADEKFNYEFELIKSSENRNACVRVIGDLKDRYKLIWDFSANNNDFKGKNIDENTAKNLALSFVKSNLSEPIAKELKFSNITKINFSGELFYVVKIYVNDLLPLIGNRIDNPNVVIPVSISGEIKAHFKKQSLSDPFNNIFQK